MVYAQLIDTGFVLMVIGSCAYALTATRDRTSARSQQWIEELSTLQATLKELIGEASAAGSNLDRTLLRRKQELETLIKKLEAAQQAPEKPAEVKISEVPNETWLMEPRRVAKPRKIEREAPRVASKSVRESELAKRIEVLLESKKTPRVPESEDTVDPVAYRVARRLLMSGKEIHIVARKVGLPLEEVRVLDSMIREEQLPNGTKDEASPPTSEPIKAATLAKTQRQAPTSYSRGLRLEEPVCDSWSEELNSLLEAQEEKLIRRETTLL